MAEQILSVSQINAYLQKKLDADPNLSSVAIRGEISNYKLYPSGHHYFTVKDEASALKCVMFKGNAVHLRFRPENGMKVIAMGKISVYPRDGAYQLYCSSMTVDGIGDLHAAFEQLKAKLAAQGLFDPAHKKPIPQYPQTVGIITSSAGAAVHDILRILRMRYPLCRAVLLPVRVQGVEAPAEIAAAIRYANRHQLADLLIVGRGGGSIEDLWAFNDERVSFAIFDSNIPVISAVGHEPDITIADYTADLRAATPSNGAELAVPDQDVLRQTLDGLRSAMASSLLRQIRGARQQLDALSASAALRDPSGYIQRKQKDLMLLTTQLKGSQIRLLDSQTQRYIGLTAKLDAMSPLKVLTRGYAMAQNAKNAVLKSVSQVQIGENIRISFSDGSLNATVTGKENRNEQENDI